MYGITAHGDNAHSVYGDAVDIPLNEWPVGTIVQIFAAPGWRPGFYKVRGVPFALDVSGQGKVRNLFQLCEIDNYLASNGLGGGFADQPDAQIVCNLIGDSRFAGNDSNDVRENPTLGTAITRMLGAWNPFCRVFNLAVAGTATFNWAPANGDANRGFYYDNPSNANGAKAKIQATKAKFPSARHFAMINLGTNNFQAGALGYNTVTGATAELLALCNDLVSIGVTPILNCVCPVMEVGYWGNPECNVRIAQLNAAIVGTLVRATILQGDTASPVQCRPERDFFDGVHYYSSTAEYMARNCTDAFIRAVSPLPRLTDADTALIAGKILKNPNNPIATDAAGNTSSKIVVGKPA